MRLAAVIDRAVAVCGGNGGCLSLIAKAAALKAVLTKLESRQIQDIQDHLSALGFRLLPGQIEGACQERV